jgi:hypothetical protein
MKLAIVSADRLGETLIGRLESGRDERPRKFGTFLWRALLSEKAWEPGVRRQDFATGNMDEKSAAYQAHVGGLPKGSGYYVKNPIGKGETQFDGYRKEFFIRRGADGKFEGQFEKALIDAKHFTENGSFVRGQRLRRLL